MGLLLLPQGLKTGSCVGDQIPIHSGCHPRPSTSETLSHTSDYSSHCSQEPQPRVLVTGLIQVTLQL